MVLATVCDTAAVGKVAVTVAEGRDAETEAPARVTLPVADADRVGAAVRVVSTVAVVVRVAVELAFPVIVDVVVTGRVLLAVAECVAASVCDTVLVKLRAAVAVFDSVPVCGGSVMLAAVVAVAFADTEPVSVTV